MKFSISTHIVENEEASTIDDCTKIDIQALLPQLCFNITTSAARLVSRLQMRWTDAKSRHRQAPQRQTLDDFLLANRDFPTQRQKSHANFLSELAIEKSSPTFDTSAARVTNQETKFSFSAPTIALKIGNDVGFDESTTQLPASLIPLLDLSIQGICGNLVSNITQAGVSSQFSASLRSVHARDIQKAGSHFCHFLSSVDPGLLQHSDSNPEMGVGSDNNGEEDLVKVKMTRQPNGDKETSIHFHELYIEWNPELIARVQKSLRLSSDSLMINESQFFDAIENADSHNTSMADERASPNAMKEVVNHVTVSPQFEVLFHLSKLRVNFNKDSQHRCLFSAEMNQTDLSYSRKPLGGSRTSTTVQNARLRDPDGETGGTLYGQLIGLQSGGFSTSPQTSSLVRMSFETSCNNGTDPEFHNLMKLDFSKMKFVYIHQLWMEIFDYLFEGILGNAVWGTKPKYTADLLNPSVALRSFKRTKMSIKMVEPLLLLPVCYRSPQHIRLKLNALTVANNFTREQMKKMEGDFTDWMQWFNKCNIDFRGLDVQSWDERKLNDGLNAGDSEQPSVSLNIQWPVGPTASLVKPKWNVDGRVDPILFCLSRKDYSLFLFFLYYNLLEPYRFLSKRAPSGGATEEVIGERLVLYGYEKVGAPPTTYSIKLSSDMLMFRFVLDEEESKSKKVEGTMNVNCSNASWALVKNQDRVLRQRADVESIRLSQTSNRPEWSGFPDLLLPLPASSSTEPHAHCLLHLCFLLNIEKPSFARLSNQLIMNKVNLI